MGFLKKLFGGLAAVQQLPVGTITVDRNARIIASTVSSGYPRNLLQIIARDILELLHEARVAQMPLAEISLHFGSLLILSLIHISEPTRQAEISYAVFCLK